MAFTSPPPPIFTPSSRRFASRFQWLLPILALALTVISAGPLAGWAWATCGAEVEHCGDGVDNDCDGATDEGCATCNGLVAIPNVPYSFDWRAEVRADPDERNKSLTQSRQYGDFMDSVWRFLPSHRVASTRFHFNLLDVEAGNDALFIGSWAGTGLGQSNIYSAWVATGTPAATLPFRWYTDAGGHYLGWIMDWIQPFCGDSAQVTYIPISLNSGIDGAMINARDDAYVQFTLPAGRMAYINVDTMPAAAPSPIDVDLFANDVTGGAKPIPGPYSADFSAAAGGTTGELLVVPSSAASRVFQMRIHAYSGAGRYRLFVASPVTQFLESGGRTVVNIGFQANIPWGQDSDNRAREIYQRARGWMLAATDGQFPISCATIGGCTAANLVRNVGTSTDYDIVFLSADIDSCPGTPAQTTVGLAGRYIRFSHSYWTGSSCAGPWAPDRAAQSFVHEWGHKDFNVFPDEYDLFSQAPECSHSLMAGSSNSICATGGFCHFELCTDYRHHVDPANGVSGTFPLSSIWAQAVSRYPQLVPPPDYKTSDFSNLATLRQRMGTYTAFAVLN